MRLGILGLGSQGALHAKALSAVASVEGIVAAGRNPAATRERAQSLGIEATESVEALLADPSIDAVIVSTPTATHEAFTSASFDAGKHVFCETPFALTLAEADRMIEGARRAGRILQAGLIHRFDPELQRLVGMIREEAAGRTRAVETTRLSAFAADGLEKEHHGNAIEELLTYDIHNLLWAFGRPASVQAAASSGTGKIDQVAALFQYGTMSITSLATNRMARGHPFVERIRVIGDRASLLLDVTFGPSGVRSRFVLETPDGAPDAIILEPADPIGAQMAHFVAAIEGRADPTRADGTKAREMLEVTLAAARAAETGSAVSLAG